MPKSAGGRSPRVEKPSVPERILETARAEFAAHGFAGGRVDRIGHRAGVSKGIIYYHFQSKRQLYQAVLRHIYLVISELLGEIASRPVEPAVKLASVVKEVGSLYLTDPHIPVLLMRELCDRGKNMDIPTVAVFEDLPRLFLKMLREGQADGSVRLIPEMVAYYLILAPIQTYIAGVPFRDEVRRIKGGAVYGVRDQSLEPQQFLDCYRDFLLAVLPEDRSASHSGPVAHRRRAI